MADSLVKLYFEKSACRAEVLRLDASWKLAVRHLTLPEPVQRLLGEMTAGALLLAACLKYEGSLVLQLQGDGPVRLALAEVRSGLLYRVTAQMRPGEVAPDASFTDLVNANGAGRCAVILDMKNRPAGTAPYQGVVSLERPTLAQCLEDYMQRSEQLRTHMWLAAGPEGIGGVMLQKIPVTGGRPEAAQTADAEGIDRLALLAGTVERSELLGLPAEEIARRLFWEDSPQVTAQLVPAFRCRCSREGIEQMIRRLGREEAEEIVREQGSITVTCEFCGQAYRFDSVDVARLFSDLAFSFSSKESKS